MVQGRAIRYFVREHTVRYIARCERFEEGYKGVPIISFQSFSSNKEAREACAKHLLEYPGTFNTSVYSKENV